MKPVLASSLAALLVGLAACGPATTPSSEPAAHEPTASEAQEPVVPEASPEPLEAVDASSPDQPSQPPSPEAPAKPVTPVSIPPVPAALVEAPQVEIAAGEVPAAFARCRSCHTVAAGGAHGVGPNLAGVMGAEVGSRADYAYSAAMSGSDQTWTSDLMDAFLLSPRGAVPGTKMMAAPVRDPADRQALIAYLSSLR